MKNKAITLDREKLKLEMLTCAGVEYFKYNDKIYVNMLDILFDLQFHISEKEWRNYTRKACEIKVVGHTGTCDLFVSLGKLLKIAKNMDLLEFVDFPELDSRTLFGFIHNAIFELNLL